MENEPKPRRLSPREVAAIVVGVLALIFVFENTRETKVRVIIPVVEAPLWFALVVAMLLGLAVGLLLGRRSRKE